MVVTVYLFTARDRKQRVITHDKPLIISSLCLFIGKPYEIAADQQ